MQADLDNIPSELKETFDRLLAEHQRLVNERDQIQAENLRVQTENKILREQLRLLRLEKYGSRSEKLSDGQLDLLDKEPSVVAAEVENESNQPPVTEPPAKKPKRKHPGRVELPAHLERREVKIACAPEDCVCPHCQMEKQVIGYDRSEELDVIPAYYFVKVTLREKRACPRHPEAGVNTAACPERILPKSKLSDATIVDVLVKKYGDYLPAYRQSMILERDAQIELSRKTLVSVILKAGELLKALIPGLKADLFSGKYIQADETPIDCQSQATPGRNHQAYLWEFGRPNGPVVFDFRMSRAREGPKEFLGGFRGFLQSDGYGAYAQLGEGIQYLACWAHARREFHKAHLLQKLDKRPVEILDLIGQLYEVETQAREKGLGPSERLAVRQELSRPILDKIRERILALKSEVDFLPANQLGKACNYTLKLWDRLELFLKHGELEIDNNQCENSIRPLAVGRKNWLHIGSEQAGPLVAAIASIFETCRRLKINPREYLLDALPKIAEWPASKVAELSPVAWKAKRAS